MLFTLGTIHSISRFVKMRVRYSPPSAGLYDIAFKDTFTRPNVGGGLDDIKVYKRRGGSILGFLGRAFKYAIPFVKNLIVPEIGGFTNNILDDVSQNVPFRESVKRNFKSSVKNIGKRVVRGAGRVRKKPLKSKKSSRKTMKRTRKKSQKKARRENHCKVKSSDIFSSGKFDL